MLLRDSVLLQARSCCRCEAAPHGNDHPPRRVSWQDSLQIRKPCLQIEMDVCPLTNSQHPRPREGDPHMSKKRALAFLAAAGVALAAAAAAILPMTASDAATACAAPYNNSAVYTGGMQGS